MYFKNGKLILSKSGGGRKLAFAVTGGALITASVGSMIAYLSRRKEDQDVGVGMLLGAVAGLTAGILLAYEPERRARRNVVVDQMFDEDDAEVANRRIDQVLNKPAESGAKSASHRKTIEVDEEATLEDFI